jgi:hypothetical protein
MHSAPSLLKPLGGSVQGPCNSSAKPPTPLSRNRGTSEPFASPTCTASCPWCSAVTYRACLRLQRASTPHARVPTGSRGRCRPQQRFRTRHAGAAAGFVCIGRCLGSDCVLLQQHNHHDGCWVVLDLDCRLPRREFPPTLSSFVAQIAGHCLICGSPLTVTRIALLFVVDSRFLLCNTGASVPTRSVLHRQGKNLEATTNGTIVHATDNGDSLSEQQSAIVGTKRSKVEERTLQGNQKWPKEGTSMAQQPFTYWYLPMYRYIPVVTSIQG